MNPSKRRASKIRETQKIHPKGRIARFDERSRSFAIDSALESKPLKSKIWTCKQRLDQGQEGACVGFAITHEIISVPKAHQKSNKWALELYKACKKIDPFPPGTEGTDILSGMKIATKRGFYSGYKWAFSLSAILKAVSYEGPVVMGTSWYSGMERTDSNGFVKPTGTKTGGHAWLIIGINVEQRFVICLNSWGDDWGIGGIFYLSFEDLDKLRKDKGEAAIPRGRKIIR
jgi:hypothetical protein